MGSCCGGHEFCPLSPPDLCERETGGVHLVCLGEPAPPVRAKSLARHRIDREAIFIGALALSPGRVTGVGGNLDTVRIEQYRPALRAA
jgi:hypothetical protein